MDTDSQLRSPRLLVVEDDRLLAGGLCRNLGLEGFQASHVATGEEALEQIHRGGACDLVVLDIMLPGIDGLEVCQRLRDEGNDVPVLFLTARGSDADRILGLRAGADDYLTKPFLVEELVLRVRGILRRSAWSRTASQAGPVIEFGANRVELETMKAYTASGTIDLTERELMLIRFFAENGGRVLSLPFHEGVSTTEIIRRITDAQN